MSDLKKALFVLLYDQYDTGIEEYCNSDESYIDYIVNALIEANENKCPFKNYDCIGHCKTNCIGCTEEILIDCKREPEDVWKEFVRI